MKTHKNLWQKIFTYENLLLASKKAQKGKRYQNNVGQFNHRLESNLIEILDELQNQTYQPGEYDEFNIYEPKPRMISAAPYRDRVVHHALCNIISPILENSMIFDTYANRKGKGTHKAILRYQDFAKKNKYILKCDIRKFFPSVDLEILKELIRRKIGCQKTIDLVDKIIDNSNIQEDHFVNFPGDDLFTPFERRKGLPIGNLTSQLFGNYYLSPLDHFIKDKLGTKHYIRYVDDFVIFSNSKKELQEIQAAIVSFLEKYRLKLHDNKSQVYQTSEGVMFLGHRVFPDFKLLDPANIRRFRKRVKKMKAEFFKGEIELKDFNHRVQCWFAHAAFSDTYRLRKKVFDEIYKKKSA